MTQTEPSSPLSVGISWATRIMAMGIGFVLPVLGGQFLDGRLGTRPVGLLVGMVLGFSVGVYSIVKIATGSDRDNPSKSP